MSADSPTVYKLVDGIDQVVVSVMGLSMVTDWGVPAPVYTPLPVPFHLKNSTWLPLLSVADWVTVNFAVESELYHPVPAVYPQSEVTLR